MIYDNDPSCLFEEWRGESGCGYLCLAFVREVVVVIHVQRGEGGGGSGCGGGGGSSTQPSHV